MYFKPGNAPAGVSDRHYLTMDDITDYARTPLPTRRSATGYGESATSTLLRCAVGDDARILSRRVYVLSYGNGGGTPYVYGRVSGERVRFYLDPFVEGHLNGLRNLGNISAPIILADVRSAAYRDLWDDYGYAQRLDRDGAPRRPLRTYPTNRPDDVGRLTREGRLYFAQRGAK
ncbi:hypothetical protein SEA_KIDNEYBEAN_88 [Gordonia phage KidneyBean]|uniref:Uncharacterized protein n=1 Tax=Gordonia phage KidneyBean TaxID=2301603 RepID=A0A385UFQ6_9CAUD|nr:hypothetical protein KNU11_gp88 [Gordonia phage KidneyBean]AYB69805.1 hypothetical protein SEA_KIDNEYBEAN_88 [Gordonia phage KidneyBean]